jgi:hypothetical protein
MDILEKSLNAIDEMFESMSPEEFKKDLDAVRQGVGITIEEYLCNRSSTPFYSPIFDLGRSVSVSGIIKVQVREIQSPRMTSRAVTVHGMMANDDLRSMAA